MGSTGTSFTTESSPLPCTRRARTTTPALYRLQIGRVEEVDLADLGVEGIEAEYADRLVVTDSGTGSFSSTLSAPSIRPRNSPNCSSESVGEDVPVAIG